MIDELPLGNLVTLVATDAIGNSDILVNGVVGEIRLAEILPGMTLREQSGCWQNGRQYRPKHDAYEEKNEIRTIFTFSLYIFYFDYEGVVLLRYSASRFRHGCASAAIRIFAGGNDSR